MRHPLEPAVLGHEISAQGLFLAPAMYSRDHPRPCRSHVVQSANSVALALRPTAARGDEPVATS